MSAVQRVATGNRVSFVTIPEIRTSRLHDGQQIDVYQRVRSIIRLKDSNGRTHTMLGAPQYVKDTTPPVLTGAGAVQELEGYSVRIFGYVYDNADGTAGEGINDGPLSVYHVVSRKRMSTASEIMSAAVDPSNVAAGCCANVDLTDYSRKTWASIDLDSLTVSTYIDEDGVARPIDEGTGPGLFSHIVARDAGVGWEDGTRLLSKPHVFPVDVIDRTPPDTSSVRAVEGQVPSHSIRVVGIEGISDGGAYGTRGPPPFFRTKTVSRVVVVWDLDDHPDDDWESWVSRIDNSRPHLRGVSGNLYGIRDFDIGNDSTFFLRSNNLYHVWVLAEDTASRGPPGSVDNVSFARVADLVTPDLTPPSYRGIRMSYDPERDMYVVSQGYITDNSSGPLRFSYLCADRDLPLGGLEAALKDIEASGHEPPLFHRQEYEYFVDGLDPDNYREPLASVAGAACTHYWDGSGFVRLSAPLASARHYVVVVDASGNTSSGEV